MLTELGYSGVDAQNVARTTLERRGLTSPHKQNIRATKLQGISEILRGELARSCGHDDCLDMSGARRVVHVSNARDCEYCTGSDNKRAARRFAGACVRSEVRRLVVVGGSPGLREELQVLLPAPLQIRLIDGTARRNQQQARADNAWADLVLVWGPSQLNHNVSNLYTDVPAAVRAKVVAVARRGIAALLDAGTLHLGTR
jgi:hypothetical protein